MVIEENSMEFVILSIALSLAVIASVIIDSKERKKVNTKIAALIAYVDTFNDQMRKEILDVAVSNSKKVTKEEWGYVNSLQTGNVKEVREKELVTYKTVLEMQKQLDTVTKQLNSVSEALLEKEDKRTLNVDEILARIPKKSVSKVKNPSRKPTPTKPTPARKLTKAK